MKRIIVKNNEGKKLIIQPSMIPQGYHYAGDYKEPKKETEAKK